MDHEVYMKFVDLGQDTKVWAKTMDQAFFNGESMYILYENIYDRQAQ